MGWLRSLERLLEERLEGAGTHELHVLEASRVSCRVLLDSRRRPSGSFTLVPNELLIPFASLDDIPEGFEQEVLRQVTNSMQQRGYKTLAPFVVRAVGPETGLDDVEARWTNRQGELVLGFVEGIEGPAGGSLWGISLPGVVIGRGPEANIRLVDPGLSRSHLRAQIVEEGKIILEDLGSHNGTRLGRKVLTTPVSVLSGARVCIGESVIKVWTLPGLVTKYLPASKA